MPKIIHDKLEREGRAKGLRGARLKAYIFGTLARIKRKRRK